MCDFYVGLLNINSFDVEIWLFFLGDFLSLRHYTLWFYKRSGNKSGKYPKRCIESRREKISGNGNRFWSKSSQLVKGKVPTGNFRSH